MKVMLILILSVLTYWFFYKFYLRYIARIIGENDSNTTPAVEFNDGRDYVPTKVSVLFSHQFAAIAGAGPIVGPVVAMAFGYAPVWLWILFGAVFIGAVQDYSTLLVSMRERGNSMANIANSVMGRWGFFLFIAFTIMMLVLVTSAFLKMTTISLTSLVSLPDMQIAAGESTFLKTTVKNGIEFVKIGGIASTSVIIMTVFAPLIGYLLYKKHFSVLLMSSASFIICVFSVIVGLFYPVSINPEIWMWILTVYVIIASGVPVWMMLQPRDLINSFLLYIGIAALMAGVFFGAASGLEPKFPAFSVEAGTKALGSMWPFLFITVACGAISGFHSLVTGGTVAKQTSKESDARKLGYGGMLLEGLLAILVTFTLALGLSQDTYLNIVFPKAAEGNPILAFSLAMGTLLYSSLHIPIAYGTVMGILMVEGFVITTLDTAVRLNRYLFEELWAILMKNPPALLKSYIFNSLLSAALMLLFAMTNSFTYIWNIFGTANQLMAALSLIVISIWLAARKKSNLFTLIPAVLMMITTFVSLIELLVNKYIPGNKIPLQIADIILLLLSCGVIFLASVKLWKTYSSRTI